MTLRIQIDTRALTKHLTDVERRQLPFAAARMVNTLTLKAQEAERARIQQQFTLRRPDFVLKQGVKVIGGFATKDRPSTLLGADPKADFLAKFERGGVKRPRDGRSLALPEGVRRNARDIVTAANRPRRLLERRRKVFVVKPGDARAAAKHLPPGIYERVGGKRAPALRFLYALEPAVKIDDRLRFVETIVESVRANLGAAWVDAMAYALRTAR